MSESDEESGREIRVWVDDSQEKPINIPVEDDRISITYLKFVFKKEGMLVYKSEDGNPTTLKMDSECSYLKLPTNVSEYAFLALDTADSPTTLTKKENDRFKEMLGDIGRKANKKTTEETTRETHNQSVCKRNITFRFVWRDVSSSLEYQHLGSKIAPYVTVALNGKINYNYAELKDVALDNCVNAKNIRYFEKSTEIELANFKNELLQDFKDGKHAAKSKKNNESLFWAYARESLKDTGKRTLVILLVSEDSAQSNFLPTFDSQRFSNRLPIQDVNTPPRQLSSLPHQRNNPLSHQDDILSKAMNVSQDNRERVSPTNTGTNLSQVKDVKQINQKNDKNVDSTLAQSDSSRAKETVKSQYQDNHTGSKSSNVRQISVPSPSYSMITERSEEQQPATHEDSSDIYLPSVHLSYKPKKNEEVPKSTAKKSDSSFSLSKPSSNPLANPFKARPSLASSFKGSSNKNSYRELHAKLALLKSPSNCVPLQGKEKMSLHQFSASEQAKGNFSVLQMLKKPSTDLTNHQKFEKPGTPTNKNPFNSPSAGGLNLFNSRVLKDRSNQPSNKLKYSNKIHPNNDKQHSSGGLALLKLKIQSRDNSKVADNNESDARKNEIDKNRVNLKQMCSGSFKKPECPPVKKQRLQDGKTDDSDLGNLHLKIPYNVELSDIDFGESPIVLGRGGQGCVRKGIWLNEVYAVKEIEIDNDRNSVLKEVLLTSYATHQNIIKLCGVATSLRKLHLILEYMDSYNLRDVIFKKKIMITLEDKKHIVFKALNAINYLHKDYEGKPTIIHADIKPCNILIGKQRFDNQLVVKVCDFGLSKSKALDSLRKSSKPGIGGTWSYMAPEQLLSFEQPTHKTDVWSLGCTFNELYTERNIWPVSSYLEVCAILKKRSPINWNNTPDRIRDILKPCCNWEPENRPKVEELIGSFKSVQINDQNN